MNETDQQILDKFIDDIETDNLREVIKNAGEDQLANKDWIEALKQTYPEHKKTLNSIQTYFGTSEEEVEDQMTREDLLSEKGKPKPEAVFGYFDNENHFIHLISREGTRTERVLAYKDGYYQYGGLGYLKHRFQQLMPSKATTHYKTQVADKAVDHRFGSKNPSNSLYDNVIDLTPPEWKLNFTNGILDLEKMEMEEHTPDLPFTSQIPYSYQAKPEKPEKWLDFLNEVLPNPEQQIPKLQEWFGYGLKHWDTDFEKSALLLGSTNSGKGVILSIYKAMLGEDNVSQMSLKEICDTAFGNQQLLGKMANINNDLNHHQITNTGTAKNAISGEDVTINQKEKTKFVAEPNAKHFYSANYPPRDKIDDDAYYGRWLTFRVPKTIPREDRDRKLRDKLRQEIPGILQWSIEGLKRLENQNGFTAERTPEETKDLWRKYGDPVARFYHHALQYEQGNHLKKSIAYDLLEEYCEAIGEEPQSMSKLTRYITNQKPAFTDGQAWIDGKNERVYENVKLTEGARQKLLSAASSEQ